MVAKRAMKAAAQLGPGSTRHTLSVRAMHMSSTGFAVGILGPRWPSHWLFFSRGELLSPSWPGFFRMAGLDKLSMMQHLQCARWQTLVQSNSQTGQIPGKRNVPKITGMGYLT
eukprot:1160147-Pelagomonas_calceolata.AAC.3